MTENISKTNSFVRIVSGLSLLAMGTAKIARKPSCAMGNMMIMAGAMKVAEGYYRYCPVVAMSQAQNQQQNKTTSYTA